MGIEWLTLAFPHVLFAGGQDVLHLGVVEVFQAQCVLFQVFGTGFVVQL